MSERIPILCVDDEPHVLEGLRLHLRRRFDVWMATSGPAALELLEERGPPHIVVSDMRMPGMDGATLLREIRRRHPDVVRLLLTGHTGLDAAISAVNEGGIFRFLVKPCPREELVRSLLMAERQHQLQRSERELLEQTLAGVVSLLTDLVSLAAPEQAARTQRLRRYVMGMAAHLELDDAWQVELAAMLADVGTLVTQRGDAEAVTARLLKPIPRLDVCAAMIAARTNRPDPQTCQAILQERRRVELGAMLLRAASALDKAVHEGQDETVAARKLLQHGGPYAPQVLKALEEFVLGQGGKQVELDPRALYAGLILEQDLVSVTGATVLPRGQVITPVVLQRVHIFLERVGLRGPVLARDPSGRDGDQDQPTPDELGRRLARDSAA